MNRDLNKKCCNNCKFGALFVRCEKLENLPEYKKLCSTEMQDVKLFNDKFIEKHKIKEGYCCDDFKNFWLEYPIAIKEVNCEKIKYNTPSCGTLVKIRPCAKEYGDKTYLGFLLSDMPTKISQSYDEKNNILTISTHKNPAIFIPAIKKIIFGCESWWGEIESEEELKNIADKDISDVWYMKLLNGGECR